MSLFLVTLLCALKSVCSFLSTPVCRVPSRSFVLCFSGRPFLLIGLWICLWSDWCSGFDPLPSSALSLFNKLFISTSSASGVCIWVHPPFNCRTCMFDYRWLSVFGQQRSNIQPNFKSASPDMNWTGSSSCWRLYWNHQSSTIDDWSYEMFA